LTLEANPCGSLFLLFIFTAGIFTHFTESNTGENTVERHRKVLVRRLVRLLPFCARPKSGGRPGDGGGMTLAVVVVGGVLVIIVSVEGAVVAVATEEVGEALATEVDMMEVAEALVEDPVAGQVDMVPLVSTGRVKQVRTDIIGMWYELVEEMW